MDLDPFSVLFCLDWKQLVHKQVIYLFICLPWSQHGSHSLEHFLHILWEVEFDVTDALEDGFLDCDAQIGRGIENTDGVLVECLEQGIVLDPELDLLENQFDDLLDFQRGTQRKQFVEVDPFAFRTRLTDQIQVSVDLVYLQDWLGPAPVLFQDVVQNLGEVSGYVLSCLEGLVFELFESFLFCFGECEDFADVFGELHFLHILALSFSV